MSDIPKYIEDFIQAVCPDAPNLYIQAFNEKTCIIDATKLISDLRARVQDLEENVAKLRKPDAVRIEGSEGWAIGTQMNSTSRGEE